MDISCGLHILLLSFKGADFSAICCGSSVFLSSTFFLCTLRKNRSAEALLYSTKLHQHVTLNNQRVTLVHQSQPTRYFIQTKVHQRVTLNNQCLTVNNQRVTLFHQSVILIHQRPPARYSISPNSTNALLCTTKVHQHATLYHQSPPTRSSI